MPRTAWTRSTLLGLGALIAVACGPTRRPDGGEGPLPVGTMAPEVVGEDASGKTVRLSHARGKLAVVYFYPKDGTPGCTAQACAFRDAFDRLAQAGVVVFGVSRDSAESHREFRASRDVGVRGQPQGPRIRRSVNFGGYPDYGPDPRKVTDLIRTS